MNDQDSTEFHVLFILYSRLPYGYGVDYQIIDFPGPAMTPKSHAGALERLTLVIYNGPERQLVP